MFAKLRLGVDVLTLQREMLHGIGNGSRSPKESRTQGYVSLGEKPRTLKPLLIFYGSSTGTCQGLADILKTTAPQYGFDATMQPLDAAKENLPKDTPIVFITSTMYEGQAPDNAAEFLDWLQEDKDLSLDGVTFAVFGCGSSMYHCFPWMTQNESDLKTTGDWKDTFQRTAITIDLIMRGNRALPMASRGVADVSEGSVLSDFDAWQSEHLWPGIAKIYHANVTVDATADVFDIDHFSRLLAKDSSHTFNVSVVQVAALTDSEDRPKYHMELELPRNIKYQVGDYLEVVPENSDEDIKSLMDILRDRGYDLADPVIPIMCSHLELRHKAGAKVCYNTRHLLFLECLSDSMNILTDFKQIDLLLNSCANDDDRYTLSALTESFTAEERRPSVLEVLKKYPSIKLPLQRLATMLPPIRPRQYSISSSPLACPNSLTITWSLIKHAAPRDWPDQEPILGLASHYLASLKVGGFLRCSVRPGQQRFRPPVDLLSTPMIMICAGSGIAPFRGFVQDRMERLVRDPSLTQRLAPALLYVGCRGPEQALYAAELRRWQESGAVDVRFTYSRHHAFADDDHVHVGYVQDRIWKEREELVRAWDEGAKVFVCGSRLVSHSVRDVVQKIYKEEAESRCGLKTDDDTERWWVEILRDRCAVEVF